MKKIKLIFLAITFFTLSVAHSQTDEVKRNLYEQEKIRIEKLEKDAQYSGDDEFVRKRMNLPPKLPSFEQRNPTADNFDNEFNAKFGSR